MYHVISVRSRVEYLMDAHPLHVIPANGITTTGQNAIRRLLEVNGFWMCEEDWGGWDLLNGNGRLSRRIAHAAYKCTGKKLPSDVLTSIGNLSHMHRTKPVVVWFTRDFDWEPGTFGRDEERSCYFGGEYEHARSTIYASGGFAIHIRDVNNQPLTRCFGLFTKSGIVLFNAYGEHSVRQIAGMLADTWLMQCNSVILDVHTHLVYVNTTAEASICGKCGGGYYIGPHKSGEVIHVWCNDKHYHGEYMLYAYCSECDERYTEDDMYYMYSVDESFVCPECYDRYYYECAHCYEPVRYNYATSSQHGEPYCEYCWEQYGTECEFCREPVLKQDTTDIGGHILCEDCALEWCTTCERHNCDCICEDEK